MAAILAGEPVTTAGGLSTSCADEWTSSNPWAGCDAYDRDRMRAAIREHAALRKRWRRGSLLIGFGVPAVLASVPLLAGGGVWIGVHRTLSDEHTPRYGGGIALVLSGVATFGGAATMLALGVIDRRTAKQAARRRLTLSLLPTRDGAWLGMRLQF